MAFQNLRVGGKMYILHKDNIRIEEAEVTNITMPTMRFMPQGANQTPIYVVDIATKVGEATYNFPQIPAQMDIVDYGNNGNVVISTNADVIATEVCNIKRKSEDAIANIDRHKAIIKQCDEALAIVKPVEANTTAENEALRKELAEMRALLLELKSEKPSKSKNNANN